MKLEALHRLRSNILTAMSFERAFAKQKIMQLGETLFDHLVITVFVPNDPNFNHHVNEISGYINKIYGYKNTKGGIFNKKDLKVFLMDGFFGETQGGREHNVVTSLTHWVDAKKYKLNPENISDYHLVKIHAFYVGVINLLDDSSTFDRKRVKPWVVDFFRSSK